MLCNMEKQSWGFPGKEGESYSDIKSRNQSKKSLVREVIFKVISSLLGKKSQRCARPTSLIHVYLSFLLLATGHFQAGWMVAMRNYGAPEDLKLWLHHPSVYGEWWQGNNQLFHPNTETGESPDAENPLLPRL